jgi:hypothetical protein
VTCSWNNIYNYWRIFPCCYWKINVLICVICLSNNAVSSSRLLWRGRKWRWSTSWKNLKDDILDTLTRFSCPKRVRKFWIAIRSVVLPNTKLSTQDSYCDATSCRWLMCRKNLLIGAFSLLEYYYPMKFYECKLTKDNWFEWKFYT